MKRFIICLLAAMLLLAACAPVRTDDTDIAPHPDEESPTVSYANLYFGAFTGEYLLKETRILDIAANENPVKYVLDELIKGPINNDGSKIAIINPETTVVSSGQVEGTLTVTLSHHFLDFSFLGKTDEQELNKIKYNAIYSVVNTLIESTDCERVQILISRNGEEIGRRMTSEEVGRIDGLRDVVGELGWNYSKVLTAENTLGLILDAFKQGEVLDAYTVVSFEGKPSEEEFEQVFSEQATLERYSIEGSASVGGGAVVFINCILRHTDGQGEERVNVPVRLVKENDVFRIEYSELVRHFAPDADI